MANLFLYVIPILILVSGVYLSFYTSVLKDISNQQVKPYSFSRTQLMWWTLIILPSVSICYARNNFALPNFDNSVLLLLGIGSGTTLVSSLIDTSDVNASLSRHQNSSSANFFADILSDANGISIHRLQALFFNLMFGCIYLNSFFLNPTTLPAFNNTELGLLGISSASFLALKTNENKAAVSTTTPANPTA